MSGGKVIGAPMMGNLPTEEVHQLARFCPTDSMPTSAAEYIEQIRERRAGGAKMVKVNEVAKKFVPSVRSGILGLLDSTGEEKGVIASAANFVREKIAGRPCPLNEADKKRLEELYLDYKRHCSRRLVTLPQHKAECARACVLFMTDLGERYDYLEVEPELTALLGMASDLIVPIHAWAQAHGYIEDDGAWNRMGRPNLGLAVAPGTPTTAGSLGKIHDPILNVAKEVVGYEESDRPGSSAFVAPTIDILGPKIAKVSHPAADEAAVPIRTATGTPLTSAEVAANPPVKVGP